MRDEITALLIAVTGLIVSQLTSFIRSRSNRKRIEAAEKRVQQNDVDLKVCREKNEQDTQALINRVMQEALDRNVTLMATIREEREEYKHDRAEWREERAEWKKERLERDKQIALLDAAYKTIKREQDAANLELEATKQELARVREESDDRENVIRDQSVIIAGQAETITRHEQTIAELQERVKTLEDMNARLERLRTEALAATAPALPPAPSTTLIDIVRKRATDETPKIEPTGDDAA